MTENEMRIFKCVYEAQTLTQAARNLFLSQSYVTRTIQKIEHDYETVLFVRKQRKLLPTPDGDLFYAKACRILNEMDSLDDLFRKDTVAVLSILASPYLADTAVAGTLIPFLEEYSDIKPDIRVYSSRFFQELLLERPCDVILSPVKLDLQDYVEADRFDEPLCMLTAVHASLPARISLQVFCVQPLLLREPYSSISNVIRDLFTAAEVSPRIVAESSSSLFLLQMAAAGKGVAVIPYMLYKAHSAFPGIRMLEPSDFTLTRTVRIYVNTATREAAHVQQYLNRLLTFLHQKPPA